MTTPSFHSYRPADGHGLAHNPLNAIVAPRPIGWIGTVSATGVPNLAPYSFFNLFAYSPPIIGFSSSGVKDSLTNARATGVFTWNLVGRSLAEAMNATSAEVAPDVDEFALAGLEPLASVEIAAPRVAASPVQFECRVTDIMPLRGLSGAQSGNVMVFGEVVHIHIDPACLHEGIYRTTDAVPVARGGGPADYYEIRPDTQFLMKRPG
ncbi:MULTISPECIES: flavin reductase family protein [unclassified Sphingobium]|uniref:flavin reductase family protein n=1 Tax=unclassified Sphingobium TaxID=2611147 RepID=UPI00222566B7|nr:MULTISPECIES: flavin reductase family protein [unclassified Sphingobium]MCW2380935.1 flavin reductase (DIM6/NTAB) family NADH-FMN oxidoreductase RutF [Sphingobium sp. B2D3B]MCW2398959.1 flavin reductase (DIM6/NTAB) family NADH-FMN oxidoreductase RutF [Sphingobium sp. B2D3C]